MKFYSTGDGKAMKAAKDKLTALDRAILARCEVGMNILRILKCGKPYRNKSGDKVFASTDEIKASVEKLQKLGVLKGR